MHEDLSYAEIFGEEGVQLKLKIMHAVDRSLDQITVSRVCERAGVSRQTFYRNFDSKYSLHWWWPMHVHRFYLAEVGRTIDWETGYYHHVQLLSMEKDYFKVATQYTVNFPCVNSLMPDFRKCAIVETLKDYRGVSIDEDLMFSIDSWVKTETEVFTEWYRLGTVPDPETAAKRLVDIMPTRLYEAMRME
ncbi:MAG: helix-turn-helix transcriptional regulator [Eggerthellaceae bacterium]|nr:helix-turn-helix transcriptional regulator [Eggerthellaceae bacterium]